jgi:hypothetical protein
VAEVVTRKTSAFLPLAVTILASEQKRQNEWSEQKKNDQEMDGGREGRLELDSSEEKEKD